MQQRRPRGRGARVCPSPVSTFFESGFFMGNFVKKLSDRACVVASNTIWMEDEAIAQLITTSQLEGMKRVAGMPDLHPGCGHPVGAAFFRCSVSTPRWWAATSAAAWRCGRPTRGRKPCMPSGIAGLMPTCPRPQPPGAARRGLAFCALQPSVGGAAAAGQRAGWGQLRAGRAPLLRGDFHHPRAGGLAAPKGCDVIGLLGWTCSNPARRTGPVNRCSTKTCASKLCAPAARVASTSTRPIQPCALRTFPPA